MKFCQSKYDKISVWGFSIGGIAANSVLKHNVVKVLINDRTFSSIDNIVQHMFKFKFLARIYKLFFLGDSNTTKFYSHSNKTTKITLCDHNDTIVPDLASIKTHLALSIVKYKTDKSNTSFVKSILGDIEYERFMKSLLEILENKSVLSEFEAKEDNIILTEENKNLLSKKSSSQSSSSNELVDLLFENDNYMELKEYIENLDAGLQVLTNVGKFDQADKEYFINVLPFTVRSSS